MGGFMKRQDIHKVLIIGSGPIIIGQACEFDYSGTQACKALKKLGYEIVLVNSNPATIMTDPDTADITYIEPLNVERLEQIIEKERPDALLPNLGGQSGLNLCSELQAAGVLDKYNVKVIGVQVDAIERGEDRIEFKNTMNALGVEMARSDVAYSVDEALAIADKLGYPVVLRPAYTMGGAGGGLVYNKEELKTVCARGLQASLVGQVLVEESILGWEELELEVVRDAKGNMITVCFIENIDPVGVHTGDSFCSAPMLTISEDVQKKLTSKKEEEAKIAKEEAVLDAVIADAKMEIPDAMIETQQRQMLENFAQRIQAQGLTLEQYMQFTGLTAQTMMEQLKPEALKRIQSRLVLEAVAAAEKMEATEEDFEAEIKSMAEAYQMEADKVKELLGEQGAKQVKEDLCVRKAADFIVDNAKEAKAAAKKTTKKEKAAEEKPEEA